VGWFSDSALTQAWTFATDEVTGDLTLYAKWDCAQDYHYENSVCVSDSKTETCDTSTKPANTEITV